MARVKLENVSKIYDNGYEAVKDMNLDIKDKEFVVLVGPSGCGKSTTLRMIAGLEDISQGKLLIDDKIVNDVSSKDRDIAMVFQSYALYPHMTIRENMGFALKMKKLKKDQIKTKVEEIAKTLKLEDLLDRKPAQLSGGQRQRVALGRAMVRNPKVFLLDEPLSNLDAKLRVEMRTEIVRLHEKLDTTFIYVTHDQIEAMTMGDRIAVINEGKLVQFDTPLNLYFRPKNKFIGQFIGSPKMNLIETNLYRDGSSFYIDLFGEKLLLPASKTKDIVGYQMENKKILFGIRSEEFSYKADSKLKVVFDNVEYMGSDSYGYIVSSYKDAIVMRFRASDPVVAKKPMPIGINLENSYFFDINSEDCISYPSKKIDIKNLPISDIVYGVDTEKSKSLENLIYSSL
ncbi:ABC transporter ATP-binding protein [Finegoldia magna]|uniref:ABC transporter ATP-binding protein n=1 Tax=Finegoldia magna TaxID=1260 RepID=UPI002804730C|nr:ABC transporter ATP-binding protein [Finegoldia magna]MDU1399952.1 ABC transporter ATP-binding protein [Finegoldia magna]MDU1831922.1 ABC transporter ATP-binding protein [Finegoldia magna]MDU5271678.1 ABC transporter ATP-binding protein [Finegoldia magna]MDU5976653.1 ABC transporter ATP-binding protein [Finegoldia magna]